MVSTMLRKFGGLTCVCYNSVKITELGLIPKCLIFSRVKDIYSTNKSVGKKAEIKGWVKSVRKLKENVFVDVDDGSWPKSLQITIPKDCVPEGLTYGSSIAVDGRLNLNPNKQIELIPDVVKVIGPCVVIEGYPFAPRKSYHPDYIRQYIHLRPRTRAFGSLLRVRHHTSRALDQYFDNLNFIKIDVPILTSNDCEGAGEVFLVKPESKELLNEMAAPGKVSDDEVFFNGKTYLTVSGQLHLEVAARALGNVYCCGPTFRAENSKSRLHLAEFYMAEAEIAFINNLADILNITEGLVKHVCKYLMDNAADDLALYSKSQDSEAILNIQHFLKSTFAVETYDNVCNILESHRDQFVQPLIKGEPLSKEHELFLVKHNDNTPMFVVEWPADIKAFYMKAVDGNPDKVHAVDLLCTNVGELSGGSLREDDYSILESKLKAHGLDEKLSWYLELRKFGNVPSGGFGMGFERLLQVILGIPNIKDAIPFPRWPHNCKL